MSLPPGHRLGPYEIIRPLGAGGMGTVYEARDTRLDRAVAVKLLPDRWAEVPRLRARLEREARVVSRVTHPHVCTLYDVGEAPGPSGPVFYLVMERVQGETLAARLACGPLTTAEVVELGTQIAEALAAAHRQRVLHRDLKPGNIMITRDGVKVLDFGLATTLREAAPPPDTTAVEHLPTAPMDDAPLTEAGDILGTVPYMSPEQLEGREIDERTDIFALGAVLHEMATGQRAFAGNSRAGVIAAVLEKEPETVSRLRPASPPALDRVVMRCLAKNPDHRWHHAADVRIALEEIASAPTSEPAAGPGRTFGRAGLLAAVLAALALGAAVPWFLRPSTTPPEEARKVSFSFRLPDDLRLDQSGILRPPVSVAPDASFVAFAALSAQEDRRIYRRDTDSIEIVAVPGTEGGRQPFVSPDGRWIGFFTEKGGLAKVPSHGGLPQEIFDGERLLPAGARWEEDGRVFFPRGLTGGIGVIAASGRDFEFLTRPDQEAGEIGHWNPRLLPDGHRLLFQALTETGFRNWILDLDTGEQTEIGAGGSLLQYVDTGHLVWSDGSDVVAVPFDAGSGRITGERKTLLSQVGGFEVTSRGALVSVSRSVRASGTPFRWSPGKDGPVAIEGAGQGSQVRISPDGRWLALTSTDIWLVDMERGIRSRFTSEGVISNFPVWSPDGERLVFNSLRRPHGVWLRSADGVGEARLLIARENQIVFLPSSWSADGSVIALTELSPDGQSDVSVIELDSQERRPVVATPARESSPAFSPDGRWLAYVSDASGREEVYVRPYPQQGRHVPISSDGGRDPRWTDDGRLLFRGGRVIYEAALEPDGERRWGTPRRLTELESFSEPVVPYAPGWDVAPDGDLIYVQALANTDEPVEITVRLGWARQLVASGE